MNYVDCFHEICHLWTLVFYLDVKQGRAFVEYYDDQNGMLSVEGYTLRYNGVGDLENAAKYMVSGIAGEDIIGEFKEEDDIFEIFSSDDSYGQDLYWFNEAYDAAVKNHSIEYDIEDWFYLFFDEVKDFLNKFNLSDLEYAANFLLENEEYILVND